MRCTLSVREHIAENILFYRTQRKLTQKDIATAFNTSPSTVSSWERGANSPDIETLFKLCQMLNISIDTMFGSDLPQSTPAPQYAADEVQLIEEYRAFNDEGKEKIRDYVADLKCNAKYKKCTKPIMDKEA